MNPRVWISKRVVIAGHSTLGRSEERIAGDLNFIGIRHKEAAFFAASAFAGEDYEVESMYPGFAADAAEEGQKAAETAFKQVAKIEAHHRARYKKLLEMVEAGMVFKREQPIKWKCSVCGYIYEGNEPPPKCPSCKNPKEYYEPASLDF
jgi:rubrerythrin